MPNELADATYVSFATFRKTGAAVPTPVWCAEDGGDFYIFSAGNAGKVKRLRNSDRAQMAVCDVRGKVLGEWHSARATTISDPPMSAPNSPAASTSGPTSEHD
jgi:PPOX class probable F420-dependent enzyme